MLISHDMKTRTIDLNVYGKDQLLTFMFHICHQQYWTDEQVAAKQKELKALPLNDMLTAMENTFDPNTIRFVFVNDPRKV